MVALDQVSVEFAAAEATVLMGPSGCGKTSLLNLVAGIDRASAGSIRVGGVELTRLGERELERYRLLQVGYVFQFFNLIPSLTALENLELPMLVAGASREARARRAHQLLDSVGLRGMGGKRPEELSGGEQQRVAVCLALVNDPPLILADEPTGNLDSANARLVTELLVLLAKQGKTVVVATHDVQLAEAFARALRMRDGRIVNSA